MEEVKQKVKKTEEDRFEVNERKRLQKFSQHIGRKSVQSNTQRSQYEPYAYSSSDKASEDIDSEYVEDDAYKVVTREKLLPEPEDKEPKVQPEFDDEMTKKYYIDLSDPEVEQVMTSKMTDEQF